MVEYLKDLLLHQFTAALGMLHDCLVTCPDEHWDAIVGKYPFWQVAYHTLCFTDLYLARDENDFKPGAMHPAGWKEFDEEYPSRRFARAELIAYAQFCRRKLGEALAAETRESLEGPSGHARRTFSRGELYIYNLRHIQHHTGQLSACLRRTGPALQAMHVLKWGSSGWPAAST